MARVLLFTGKGGVGKTTLAAATAARLAAAGHKTLVVSTDPAHSLADTLDVALDGTAAEVGGAPGLYAAQVDTRRLLDDAWPRLRRHLVAVLTSAGVAELAAEELTVLPGVEELLALAEVQDLVGDGPWENVVVDCAPTAETLRLLALPEAVAGYLERLFPAHQRLARGMIGGFTGSRNIIEHCGAAADAVSRLAERLQGLRAMLADSATTVRLVLTPERVVAAETRRTLTALALLGLRVDALVANRVVPAPSAGDPGAAAGWLRARRAEQDAVLAQLAASLGGLPLHAVEYRSAEPVGLAALLALGEELGWSAESGAAPGVDLVSLRRVTGRGRELDSEFELRLTLPAAEAPAVELARIGDELSVTVDGRRRLLDLPSVLRRCLVVGAHQHPGGVTVRFRPDPAVWLR